MLKSKKNDKKLGKYKRNIIDSENGIEAKKILLIRKNNPGKKIAFASGCYDILQPGHAVFFEQMKQYGDIVVIALGRDVVISALKPGRPINPEMNRAYLLASMKDVDYVIIDSPKMEEGKIHFGETLKALKPDVFVLNDDDSSIDLKRKLCKKLKIKFVLVKREVPAFLKATSSSDIIEKISLNT